MRNKGFSFIEVIVSMGLFLIVIFPLMELNREILKINRKYIDIEHSEKNFQVFEKKILSRGHAFLASNLGSYEYIFSQKGEIENINYIVGDIKFPYKNKENERFLITIQKVVFGNGIEEEKFLILKMEFRSKNRIFKKKRLISQYDEYY